MFIMYVFLLKFMHFLNSQISDWEMYSLYIALKNSYKKGMKKKCPQYIHNSFY